MHEEIAENESTVQLKERIRCKGNGFSLLSRTLSFARTPILLLLGTATYLSAVLIFVHRASASSTWRCAVTKQTAGGRNHVSCFMKSETRGLTELGLNDIPD